MRRTFALLALGSLALASGCVSPSDRIPVNRSYQNPSLFGARRQPFFTSNPATRSPTDFFGPGTGNPMATASNWGPGLVPVPASVPAQPLVVADSDRVARPVSPERPGGMSRFFPSLFGQGAGEPDRLAKARSPERLAMVRRGEIERTQANATDPAVTETSAEVEAPEVDAPTLPVSLKIEAYPVKPSASLPVAIRSALAADQPPFEAGGLSTAPPREELAAKPEPEHDRRAEPEHAGLLAIPGLEDAPQDRPTSAPTASEEASAGRRRLETKTSVEEPPAKPPAPANLSASNRFRVTPRPTGESIFDPPAQSQRRGPFTRLLKRIRGE